MFKNLDRRPTVIERLGLHLAVVSALTGLFGGALAIGDVASTLAKAAPEAGESEVSRLASVDTPAARTDTAGQLR